MSDEVRAKFATVADLVTRARSGVVRDGYSRQLDYVPEPEAPTRFAKVLLSLAQGIALAYDSPAVTEREFRLALRVALDCVPPTRRSVLMGLPPDVPSDAGELAARIGPSHSETGVYRALQDLEALDLVVSDAGSPRRWTLPARWADVLKTLDAGPANECPGGGSGGQPGGKVTPNSRGKDGGHDTSLASLGLTRLDDPDGAWWRRKRA